MSIGTWISYVDAAIIDMEVIRRYPTKNGGGMPRVIWYKYICQDMQTGEHYETERLPAPFFEVWSGVRVLKDASHNAGEYWVDINTVHENQRAFEIATNYHKKKYLSREKEVRMMPYLSYKASTGILVVLCAIFLCLFLLLGGFLFGLFGCLFFILSCINIPYYFQERKMKSIRAQNLPYIARIVTVEKAGNWKVIPLGYIPPEEKIEFTVDVTKINDRENPIQAQFDGYRYLFQVEINGEIRNTESFHKPFPQKYFPGAKIRLYFQDPSYTWEFMTDIDSVDELN